MIGSVFSSKRDTTFLVVAQEVGANDLGPLDLLQIEDPLLDTLAIDEVYAEKVGEQASQQQLHAAFDTTDIKKIVKEIMINGKFH